MIDKDNIQELFSRSLENHTVPVRPEVWNGLQAKMAAAGVTSVAAAKGVSLLTKWIIGGAAVTGTAVVTTIAVLNSSSEQPKKMETAQTERTQEATTPAVPENEQPTVQQPFEQDAQNTTREPIHFVLPQIISGSGGYEEPLSEGGGTELSTGSNENSRGSVTENPGADAGQPVVENHQGSVVLSGIGEDEPANEATSTPDKTYKAPEITFPNVFTPDGDRINDEYFITCENVKSVNITIMNTKNQVVYQTTDPDFKWNGTNEAGEPVAEGTYACVVVCQDMAGKMIKRINLLDIKR